MSDNPERYGGWQAGRNSHQCPETGIEEGFPLSCCVLCRDARIARERATQARRDAFTDDLVFVLTGKRNVLGRRP
jgi:hypothetical protein